MNAIASPRALDEMERVLADSRGSMTLAERVAARRAIDAAAGTIYTPPAPEQVHKVARTMHSGMRRIRATN
ncbi:hypothetical protein [Rhodococcoides kyotonense]|uniref:Uncharacterized protein n=1 Tax=Rhodococcoides kyotonense TaxID=398843 RepID=A0A239FTU4_9NOCA|nr:hypothetical protein [Rhodococcus kyotonensis]SNS59572.1 hypothetical protein SAMN05421642_103426 [Rhodococcus kyotonensis]